MTGKTISHYRIEEKLGEGGMGVVYKAEDLSLQRTVALKFLAPHALDDPESKERFLREARSAASLDHPNVCMVFEIGEEDGQTFLAMAFIDGQTVKDKIAERPLPFDEALHIAIQIGEGLREAHENGVVHRDVKPHNVMLTSRGQVKIMDFGLAQLAGRSQITKTGLALGTLSYMSPEQLEGQAVDRRSDIWSFGAVLYEMLAQRTPFAAEHQQAISHGILSEEPEPVTALRSGLPIEIDRVLGKALAKSPEQRYQHIDDMLVDLRALGDSVSGLRSASTASSSGYRSSTSLDAGLPATSPVPPAAHSRRSAYLVIGVLAAIVLGAAWYWSSRPAAIAPVGDMVVLPFTSDPGDEGGARFSPDGNQIVYSARASSTDESNIFIRLIDSPNTIQLTEDPANEFGPDWSPDGRSIVFTRFFGGGKAAYVVIPALGGRDRIVAEVNGSNHSNSSIWAPDGKRLIGSHAASPGEPSELYSFSVDTGEEHQLTAGRQDDLYPALSPDGRTLAFVRGPALRRQIHVLDLSGDLEPRGEARPLTFGNPVGPPAWSTDGRRILFGTGLNGGRLWSIAADGSGKPERLFPTESRADAPVVSPTGTDLVYARLVTDTNIIRLDISSDGPDEKSAHPLLASTQQESNAHYSPDGERIVFESSRGGDPGIWVSNADGSEPAELFSVPGKHAGAPRWSPDGQRIVFDSSAQGSVDIYVMRHQGGAPVRITRHKAFDATARWSRDGKWFYFASRRSGSNQIWKVAVDQNGAVGEPIQFTSDGGFSALEDPEGRYLYYTKSWASRDTPLWKKPVSGGEESQVLPSVVAQAFEVLEGGIYFLSGSEDKFFLRYMEFSTGEDTILRPVTGRWRGSTKLSISPDRRHALFTGVRRQGWDLMLVKNFRF